MLALLISSQQLCEFGCGTLAAKSRRGAPQQQQEGNLFMTKTYAQIQKQIQALSREAEQVKRKEVDGVVARIKEAIAVYGLTAGDLGLTGARVSKAGPGKKRGAKSKGAAAVKFRDEAGNTWVGRGPRPHWLRDALAAGKKLEDFAVGSSDAKPNGAAPPAAKTVG